MALRHRVEYEWVEERRFSAALSTNGKGTTLVVPREWKKICGFSR